MEVREFVFEACCSCGFGDIRAVGSFELAGEFSFECFAAEFSFLERFENSVEFIDVHAELPFSVGALEVDGALRSVFDGEGDDFDFVLG